MNKEEFQVGDLVGWIVDGMQRVGLVIDDHAPEGFVLRYRVLWFGTDQVLLHSGRGLIKLDIPNE